MADCGDEATGEQGGEMAIPATDEPTTIDRSPVVRMMATGRAIGGSGAGGSIVLYGCGGTGEPMYCAMADGAADDGEPM